MKCSCSIVHTRWRRTARSCRLTLAEITLIGTYTYTTADLRATVEALYNGDFGDLGWIEEWALVDGAAAFADLHNERTAAAQVVLRPH